MALNVYKDSWITLEMLEERGILRKNNFAATTAPSTGTVAAANYKDYSVGSIWTNIVSGATNDRMYVCLYNLATGSSNVIIWGKVSMSTVTTIPA